MYHPYHLYFLVLFLAPIYARAIETPSERGNVLDFSPKGDFKFMFSKHENEIHDEENELVAVRLPNAKGDIQLTCNKYLLNAKSDNKIPLLRATLVTNDDIELDSFGVSECDQKKLLDGIKVTQTTDEKLKKEYQIDFRDDKGNCRKRTYLVEITPHDVNPTIAVTRSDPVRITGMAARRCPVKKVNLAIDWYDNDVTHDYALYNDYKTMYRFGCDMCWVLCRETKDGKFVDLIVGSAPIDRLKVTSCTGISLRISIKMDLFVQTEEDRFKTVYMTYMKTDGACYTIEYKFDVQEHLDRMLERAFVTRGEPTLNDGCKVMKAKGLARSLVIKALHHFGRPSNPSVRTEPSIEEGYDVQG